MCPYKSVFSDFFRSFIDSLLQQIQAPGPSPPSQPTTISMLDHFIIPKSPATCKKRDFPEVKFWTKNNWKAYRKDCLDRQKDYGKLDFISDEKGEVVSGTRLV